MIDASSNRLVSAQRKVDRAVEAKFGHLRTEKETILQNLDLLLKSPRLSREERERAEAQKIRQQLELKQIETNEAEQKEIWNIATSIASQVSKLPNGSQILDQIQNSKTKQEALRLATPYLAQAEQKNTQIVEIGGRKQLIDTQTGEVVKDLGISEVPPEQPATITSKTGETLVYGTPEYVTARLQATSGSKTKPVASEREQLGKFANVVSLTDNLMNSLNTTTNDPILGYLKSLNPYDFDARAVNAQVIALVPSVARALYGEVGVLTDTDIERYLKTLPNIRSTTEQNKFIAMMTLANARRAYEQTLLNLANSNVNVSGFSDSYNNLVQKLDSLEKDLNAGDEFEQEFNALPDEIKTEKETFGFKDILKFIFKPLGF